MKAQFQLSLFLIKFDYLSSNRQTLYYFTVLLMIIVIFSAVLPFIKCHFAIKCDLQTNTSNIINIKYIVSLLLI